MNDLETALIATMESLVRLHSEEHDYLNECDCIDAQAFRQGEATLARHGINYATVHTMP